MKEIFMSPKQYAALEDDLRKAEASLAKAREAIGAAAEKGDLSENAEYDAAREDEHLFIAKVAELRNKYSQARVINKKNEFTGEIGIGTKTTIEDLKSGEKETWIIVGAGSFDITNGEMPYNGPFGKALCGRKEGEEVDVKVPAGKFRYRILSVEEA